MDIKDKLLELLKSKEAELVSDVTVAGVSAANPVAGVFLLAAQEVGKLADEKRIDAIMKGLSTGLNQEMRINQLYNYVSESEENAFYFSNTLRKALLSDSTIACTIMGRMLATHMDDGSVYTQDDNIIFHALSSATNQDIRGFMRILKKYRTENDELQILKAELEDEETQTSLDWCVFNRILGGAIGIQMEDMDSDYDDNYSLTSAAIKLYEYADSIKQVIDYSSSHSSE